MQPNVEDLQICYRDSNTGAWLPYLDPQLQICIFDPSSQTYIPLQLLQSTYVGASNPLGDQTQSFSSSMHTIFDPYVSSFIFSFDVFEALRHRLATAFRRATAAAAASELHELDAHHSLPLSAAAVRTRSRPAELIELDVHQFLSLC
ncbi:hypothetical protein M413DRAFT_262569 [Hebeloma cylindrosporum]|uniref:Uncharacterized protein n=1 Tax=Hebeloma cylindrosporum TaxID=76867 RepID=A0A0C3CRS9_HEBCY|nr:hypothetical protein M413DRAFT_262569 [Hebeloma cylindrosporum h7]